MTQENKNWTVTVQQEGDDFILPLPQDLLDSQGWKEGDTIEWVDRKDGTWEIRKSGNESADKTAG